MVVICGGAQVVSGVSAPNLLSSYLRPQFDHVRLHLIVGLVQIFDFFIQLLDFLIVLDA